MFTGLIQSICPVRSLKPAPGGAQLEVHLDSLAEKVNLGDSVAINGACLTVAKLSGSVACFDLSSETLAGTTLGTLRPASQVNVELALKADARFAGHIVQGHIDGIGKIIAIERKADFADIKFAAGAEILAHMLPKGAVAVDGISLTITDLDAEAFRVAVIPLTLQKTTLGRAKIGREVNIETDLIAKITKKHLEEILPLDKGLTEDKLRQFGFA